MTTQEWISDQLKSAPALTKARIVAIIAIIAK